MEKKNIKNYLRKRSRNLKMKNMTDTQREMVMIEKERKVEDMIGEGLLKLRRICSGAVYG